MSGDRLRVDFRRRVEAMEERVAEIRHRLVIEEARGEGVYGGGADVAGVLEMEEELLEEAAELERILEAGETKERASQRSFSKSGKGLGR